MSDNKPSIFVVGNRVTSVGYKDNWRREPIEFTGVVIQVIDYVHVIVQTDQYAGPLIFTDYQLRHL